jgi:hypothetical protein
MSVATARRPVNGQQELEWSPVPIAQDAQLQSLLRAGWEISREEKRKVHLTKEGGKKMVHHRRRA